MGKNKKHPKDTYWCRLCKRRHKRWSAIGVAHAPKPSFNRQYEKLVKESAGQGGHATGMMRKILPTYIEKALGAMARSGHEWGGGLDFELQGEHPERMITNRGRSDRVSRDADLELNFHTHPPPPRGMAGWTVNIYPSAADVANTSFSQPHIIAVVDNDGRKRFVLIRSIIPVRNYSDTRAELETVFKEIFACYPYPFPTRKARARFGKEWKAALNDRGFDFEHIKPDQHIIAMRTDDEPEREITFKRKGRREREILASFKEYRARKVINKNIRMWFHDDKVHVAWQGPENLSEWGLGQWRDENDLVLVNRYFHAGMEGQYDPYIEYVFGYDPGERTPNEPGGPSWRAQEKPKKKKRYTEKFNAMENQVKRHLAFIREDIKKREWEVGYHHLKEIQTFTAQKKEAHEKYCNHCKNEYNQSTRKYGRSSEMAERMRELESILEELDGEFSKELECLDAIQRAFDSPNGITDENQDAVIAIIDEMSEHATRSSELSRELTKIEDELEKSPKLSKRGQKSRSRSKSR